MEGAGAAGQGIIGIRLLEDGRLQGFLHAAVGDEEGNLLAGVLFHDLGHVREDEGLGAGHAGVTGGVGRVAQNQFDAGQFRFFLHDVEAGDDGFIAHVAGKGVMDQDVSAPFLGGFNDLIAAVDFVNAHDNVSSAGDIGRVFRGDTGDEQDVRAGFTDFGESGGGALDGLGHDDGLDRGILGELHQFADGGLDFRGEVVRIRIRNDNTGVLGDQFLSGAEFFLALGGGAGEDGDFVRGFLSHGRHKAQHHGQRQKQD